MFETEAEMTELQELLERSMSGAGGHLTTIVTGERTLNAHQVTTYLQGVKHVSLGTVNSRGEPIVAPVDGWFLHGKFIVSTAGDALRVKHMRRTPAVSACHLDGDNIGIWVHGKATILANDDPLVQEYDRAATAAYGSSPFTFGENIVVTRIDPRVMFAYAFVPSKYPESAPKG